MSSSLATFLHKNLPKTEKLGFYRRAKLSIMRLAIIWTKLLLFLATFLVMLLSRRIPFYMYTLGDQSFTQLGILQKKILLWFGKKLTSPNFLSSKSSFPRLPLLLPLAATIAEHLRAGSS